MGVRLIAITELLTSSMSHIRRIVMIIIRAQWRVGAMMFAEGFVAYHTTTPMRLFRNRKGIVNMSDETKTQANNEVASIGLVGSEMVQVLEITPAPTWDYDSIIVDATDSWATPSNLSSVSLIDSSTKWKKTPKKSGKVVK